MTEKQRQRIEMEINKISEAEERLCRFVLFSKLEFEDAENTAGALRSILRCLIKTLDDELRDDAAGRYKLDYKRSLFEFASIADYLRNAVEMAIERFHAEGRAKARAKTIIP